jgi:hypothetical protein
MDTIGVGRESNSDSGSGFANAGHLQNSFKVSVAQRSQRISN